jgi:hypothetical protein
LNDAGVQASNSRSSGEVFAVAMVVVYPISGP